MDQTRCHVDMYLYVFCGGGWEIIDKTHLIHFTSPMNFPFYLLAPENGWKSICFFGGMVTFSGAMLNFWGV